MEQPTSKSCTKCGLVKHFSQFTKGNDRYGLRYWCKPCKAVENREWARANPDKIPKRVKAPGKYSPARRASRCSLTGSLPHSERLTPGEQGQALRGGPRDST